MFTSLKTHSVQSPKTFMAPMEGITDAPFRATVKKLGCDFICTQMVHADGLLRGTYEKTPEIIARGKDETVLGIQLCGSDAELISEAAKRAEGMGFDFIDLNMGCPAKNVVKRGAGAALLKEPTRTQRILEHLVASVSIPVTVKIRAGWDNELRNALEIGRIAQEAGVELLTVHARTRSQFHKGQPDWNLVNDLNQALQIPVVGNGGIFSPRDLRELNAKGRASAVMIARGGLGNPWIFSNRYPRIREIEEMLFEHFDSHLSFYPSRERAMITFRKHIVWYTKGLANSAEFRRRVFKEKEEQKVREMLYVFFRDLDPDGEPDHSKYDGL